MGTSLDVKLEITSWDEKPFRELAGDRKLARADVELSSSDGAIEATAIMSMLLYYAADDSSTYVALLSVEGSLDGRSGGFAMTGNGTYDGTASRLELSVVPGSGTGELAGIRGTGTSVSTHQDYPHLPLTLDYDLS
jgi:hypothetical protein